MGEPIKEFETTEKAYECLKEWRERLFLNDWIIKINLEKECWRDDEPMAGTIEFSVEKRSALISIAKPNDINQDRVLKFCHELTLVHELLHLKYNWLDCSETFESRYYDTVEHSLLEQMSKSLVMTKYNLTFDWFKNFEV